MSILNYIEKMKEMYEGERITAQGPRTGFKDGNGVYDEKELLGKRVRELMDEGYDFGEAVRQAMKEGYADGGRIGYDDGQLVRNTVDGSRPGYAGKESVDRISAIKNYIKDQGKVIDGYEFKEFLSELGYKKPRDIVKGLEQGGMFQEDILGKKTITKTERPKRRGLFYSKGQTTTLNKYAELLNKQEPKKYTSSIWKELGEAERVNILQRARANDWKFKAKTKWDPLTPKQQQNIIETFDLPEDAFKKMEGIQKNIKDVSGKYGVTRYLESGKKNPLYDKIYRYAKNGFKFAPKDMLPVAKQREIVARFDLPEGFEKWNFEKYKYGIPSGGSASNPAYTKRIIDFTQGKTRFPNLAADAGTPQGWMMNQFYRTYEHQTEKMPNGTRKVKKGVTLTYKPIFETINGRQKVVGFVDNTTPGRGNTYFGIKKWHNKHGGNLLTTHPDFENVKKFVNISKRAYAEPNEVIMGLLKKGGIEPTGKLQLKHVLNYLAETQGYKATEDAVRIHHQAGVGARGIPGEAVRDLQLLKSEVNSAIMQAETKIRNAVVNNLTPNIDDVNKLKNLGASVKVGGKTYGGGSQTAIGGFKAIEKGAEEAIKKWEPKDFNKFKTHLEKIIKKNKLNITNKEAGFIATDMLKDFGKLGLKGGRLLKMLELQYEPIFEGLFYQYAKQYKGYDHGLAREELFLPKILAKIAPDLWKKVGFKPFKTGVWEGADPLIEEELIGTRWDPSGKTNLVAEYADRIKKVYTEVDKYHKLENDLSMMQVSHGDYAAASPEKIKAKEKEIENQRNLLIDLEHTLKPGTPAYEAYMRAKEIQDYEFGKNISESDKRKETRRHKEYLEHKGGKQRSFLLPKEKGKERVEDPLFKKPYTFLETDDTFLDILKPGKKAWEEFGLTDTQVGPVVKEGIKDKWKQIYDMGGIDLMDKIGIAGGVANMADGGIMSLKKKKW